MPRSAFYNLLFQNNPPVSEFYTLSLHDALPISLAHRDDDVVDREARRPGVAVDRDRRGVDGAAEARRVKLQRVDLRSEEHTSELQSHVNLVCRLLLEKKNKLHKHLNLQLVFSPH